DGPGWEAARGLLSDVQHDGRLADRDQPAVALHGELEAPARHRDRESDVAGQLPDSQPVHRRAVGATGQAPAVQRRSLAHVFRLLSGDRPIARIRHSVSPIVSYAYAPGSQVSDEFAHAVDPTGRNFRARSDPQQTISLGLSQNFEAKLKPPPGDTSGHAARKIRLLSISTG